MRPRSEQDHDLTATLQCRRCNQLMLPFLSLVSGGRAAAQPHGEGRAWRRRATSSRAFCSPIPVHQACDILFCKGNVVPVGRDQLPHIELTRTDCPSFQQPLWSSVFPEVDALLSDVPLQIPGLDGRKMSKSYGNAISHFHHGRKKPPSASRRAKTDSERMITFDPENRPGVSGPAFYGGDLPPVAMLRKSPRKSAMGGSGAS